MDEIERRRTDALVAEAASVAPSSQTWEQRQNGRPARRRRMISPWLAAAAAVVVIAVGSIIALRPASQQGATTTVPIGASRSSAAASREADASKTCDGGWTAYSAEIIAAAGQSPPQGTTAVVRFAGDRPPQAALCAATVSPGGRTTSSGATTSDGSVLGYLVSTVGSRAYIAGAFDSRASSLTFAAPPLKWSVTIKASSPGVTDLGNGWRGYVILAPAATADVEVDAMAQDGSLVDSAELSFGSGSGERSPSVATAIRPEPTN